MLQLGLAVVGIGTVVTAIVVAATLLKKWITSEDWFEEFGRFPMSATAHFSVTLVHDLPLQQWSGTYIFCPLGLIDYHTLVNRNMVIETIIIKDLSY